MKLGKVREILRKIVIQYTGYRTYIWNNSVLGVTVLEGMIFMSKYVDFL